MRVLIVSMRYLGDCVVSAALARAVKEKMPDAEVWMLTFKRNLPILEGIDILDGVIGVEAKPSYLKQLKEMASVWKKFDWSIITHQSTRTFLYGAAAGRRQSMFDVPAKSQNGWQRLFISDFVPKLGGIHKLDAISVVLKPLLNEVPHPDPVAPNAPLSEEILADLGDGPFVVFHLCSQYSDKNASNTGWRALGEKAIEAGFRIVFTGGGSDYEAKQIAEVSDGWAAEHFRNYSGRLSFGQTGALIRRAKAFVGVDTATVHVAAATGCPTIALFGPTSVAHWGPAPQHGERKYRDDLALQRSGNVSVLQHPKYIDCRSCRSGHKQRCPLWPDPSLAACLQSMPVDFVWEELKYRLKLA
ncbi:glycosyltransferase family 9 protein [Sutterella massiliensis]|uniref:Glycosyltransferase family 9 protein n=1 Tax=Sutterella massiliensis TaxID=1816689 RepID=A0ABS2DPL3_9BURK|nr:glycosyltransferase family 9 protein [Sutterella massiliensis]MBM6703276.1 glycosyltransferase family 9 protein [Sutterella massiliensis]